MAAERLDIAARDGAFFGRRKGHKLRAHQADLVGSLLPRLAVDISQPPSSDLAGLFDGAVDAICLEIGFGGGEHLLAEAASRPGTGFIGCEPYVNGMAKILARIESDGVRNIRLFAGDAIDLLRWVPQGSLGRVDLIHPDPWPKRRHWKRRFVQDTTLALIAQALSEGGSFRFVSDIDDYCAWTLAHAARQSALSWTAERADDWRRPWPDFTMTRYGRKAEREGRRSSYLRFRTAQPGLLPAQQRAI
jgi:tRNA (guanine-N7-)-methyltransferase